MKKLLPVILISICALALVVTFVLLRSQDASSGNADHSDQFFTVTFLDKDRTVIETASVKTGESARPPRAPVYDGYVFQRWDKPLTNIHSNTVFNPVYQTVSLPTIAVDNVYISGAEKTATVTVSILNNPGLSSAAFDLFLDDRLTLSEIEFNSEFGEYVTAPKPYSNPQTISFISPFEDTDHSGVLATLTFAINGELFSDDSQKANIDILCYQDNTFNAAYEDVLFETVSGSITIIP
ncbi:MAG: hypothetical protein ACI3VU_08595 [Faecousia sp.]